MHNYLLCILQNNVWAAKDPSLSDSLFTYPCPAGYCQCQLAKKTACIYSFENNEPDMQCACGRKGEFQHKIFFVNSLYNPYTGILCDECSNSSHGVSVLLNHCVTCHDAFSILIPALSEY